MKSHTRHNPRSDPRGMGTPDKPQSDPMPESARTSLIIAFAFATGVLVTDIARDWRDEKAHDATLIEYHNTVEPEALPAPTFVHDRLCTERRI